MPQDMPPRFAQGDSLNAVTAVTAPSVPLSHNAARPNQGIPGRLYRRPGDARTIRREIMGLLTKPIKTRESSAEAIRAIRDSR